MGELTIRPVTGLGVVRAGDDLAALLADAAPWLADDDVLVVTSKVVSKAEGRLVALPPPGPEQEAAREAILAAETARVVARRGPTRIVQTHHGFVLANAGIDASNVDSDHLVLLPVDPDASARALRAALAERLGVRVAVIVSDTMGRPWRLGLTDVAIGVAGIGAIRDYRGEYDAYGNELSVTQVAIVDELAAAADLVKRKADQIPAAVVRGYRENAVGEGARALLRSAAEDMFGLGTAEARAGGLRAAATLGDAAQFGADPPASGAIDRALSIVDLPVRRVDPAGAPKLPPFTIEVLVPDGDPARPLRVGADIQRLRAALAAEGLASVWLDSDDDGAVFGILAVGAA